MTRPPVPSEAGTTPPQPGGASARHLWARRCLAALTGAALLVGGACRREPPPPATTATVHVTLDWAHTAPPRAEWTNDRGYRVRLDEGFVVTHSVTLVQCPARTSLLDDLRALAAPREAWAHHTIDPRTEALRLYAPHAESLVAPAPLDVGLLLPPAADYCAAYHLVAHARPGIPLGNAPASVDLVGRRLSVYLRGAHLRPPATTFEPFTAKTSDAYGRSATPAGVVATTPSSPSLHVPAGRSVRLRVVRDAARLFDGIDFAADSGDQIARRVMANLVDGTRVALEER